MLSMIEHRVSMKRYITQKIAQFDQHVLHQGLIVAFQTIVTESGSKVSTKRLTQQSSDALQHKPVLLLSNHPHIYEVPALISQLPQRKSLHIVANELFTGLSHHTDQYLIPVSIDHHVTDILGKVLIKLMSWIKPIPHKHYKEAHLYNREQIKKAADLITQGELVMFFPNPGLVKRNAPWFKGVGHLITQVHNHSAVVMFAYIQGSSILDYLRYIPHLGRLLPTLKVYFSDQIPFSNILSGKDPQTITRHLEQDYNNWVKQTKDDMLISKNTQQ